MLGDIDEIQKEISSLEERNEVLAQSLEMYRTNKSTKSAIVSGDNPPPPAISSCAVARTS